ncbi:MAG: hypothetical protein WBC93_03490 [Sulfitobacter sp.]
MLRFAIVTVLAISPVAASAQGLFFRSKLPVNPISTDSFEVIEAYGEGSSGIWCAAASYTIRTLGKNRGRLYIERPRGPSVTQAGRKGVVFSTKPIPGVEGTKNKSIKKIGANLSIAFAIQFCRDNIIEPGDKF